MLCNEVVDDLREAIYEVDNQDLDQNDLPYSIERFYRPLSKFFLMLWVFELESELV